MEAEFWHQRWEQNKIAFHKSEAHPLLVKSFKKLVRSKGDRIFLPLCGKTLDIHWLLANGCRVAGAELSQIAIEQLFDELKLAPTVSEVGKLKHYSADAIDIFVGDIFNLSREILGSIDGIYDRAAIVALPRTVRDRYTMHLKQITHTAPQLIISFEYDQTLMDGPPFSVSQAEIKQHYGSDYDLTLTESTDMPGGLKGKVKATENVWFLQNI
ncbi:MAG: thiopurine S-methyltransferase [Cyanobacteria bacterium P01_H01_bin.119]